MNVGKAWAFKSVLLIVYVQSTNKIGDHELITFIKKTV